MHLRPARSIVAGACATALVVGVLVVDSARAAPVANPAPVAVGSGSYAAAPPAALDSTDHDVSGWVDKALYVDPSQAGKPLPTNQWWTDLLVSKFSGAMWADPLVVSNSAAGTKVFLPTQWNADGTARVLSDEIEVGGVGKPAPLAGDVVMADFETALPSGWTATGNAFPSISTGTNPNQSTVENFVGKGLANSYVGGDAATGTLTSPTFTVDRRYLALMVGGGSTDVGVRLLVGGQTVRTATGKSSERLDWVTWDLSDLQGKAAQVQLFDQSTGGWGHVLADQIVQTNDVTGIDSRFASTFQAVDARALRWGDWNVSWRMATQSGQRMDVTAARGIPYVWFETSGVTPTVRVGANAQITGLDGATVTFPARVSALKVTQAGRSFGLHLPDDSLVERSGSLLTVTSARPYLVVSAIPSSGASLADLQAHAFAIPRDTKMTYAYDPTAGEVRQTWDVTTDLLQGTDHATIQGWLPHHYVQAKQDLAFTGYGYDAPHGRMKMTVGTGGWTLRYPFTGIAPMLPAPTGSAADVVRRDVAAYSAKTDYGNDTYWGGKDVLQLAEYMAMAKQVGDTGSYTRLKSSLTTALQDWFTYTPGETAHFFARYPTWKALVGFSDSYGSFQFTDNHFHYGYFTLAAALLAMDDPAWGQKYGKIATLIAKQYANGDRSDTDFPHLRTFDVWEGHSYAGGTSSPGGNNQESSSEAIQSWVGEFMLGSALGDSQLQSTGAMGYVTERAAVQEYWLDTPGASPTTGNAGTTNKPAAYQHGTTGILFDSGQAYATYFSGDPAWIYGIQWMPIGPWFGYFGWDRTAALDLLGKMFDERPAVLAKDTGEDLATATRKYAYDVRGYVAGRDTAHAADVYSLMGDALGNVVLGYLAVADPAQYADVYAELDRRADPVARGVSMAGAVHYTGFANLALGREVLDRHVAAPTSQVYRNGSTYTYVVANPTGSQQTYAVYQGTTQIGSITVPARTQVRSVGTGTDVPPPTTGPTPDPTPTATPTPSASPTTPATVDLAKGRPATASSVSGTNTAALAVDGDGGTRWESQFADGQWLQVDLGASKHVSRVQIDWEAAAAKRFSVQVADAASGPWTTLKTVDKTSAAADDLAVDGTGRYVRIDAPTRLTQWGVSIWSLRVLGDAATTTPTTDLARGRTATASSVTGGNTAALAVDGNGGTRWESAQADGQWWQVDLGATHAVSRVQIDWETAAAKRFSIQVSDSSTGPWTTLRTVDKTSAAADDVAVSGSGRYVRIDAPTRLTQWGVSAWEIRVLGT